MKSKNDKDITMVCGCCENSIVIELTGTVICKRKGKIKQVRDCDTCRHFSLDLLKLDPLPKKKYFPDIDI